MGPPDLKRTQKSATLHMGTRTFFICSAIEGPRAAPQDFAPPAVVGRDAVVLEAAACSNIFNRSAIVMNQCSRTGGLPASGPTPFLAYTTPPLASLFPWCGKREGGAVLAPAEEHNSWRRRALIIIFYSLQNAILALLFLQSLFSTLPSVMPFCYI
jgi:hypothetical protein